MPVSMPTSAAGVISGRLFAASTTSQVPGTQNSLCLAINEYALADRHGVGTANVKSRQGFQLVFAMASHTGKVRRKLGWSQLSGVARPTGVRSSRPRGERR
jgi:hypothetical protein